ncbi:6175_t:CDS:2 [Funneliformis caledonium]|uniref:6175_t:CDS:1 n=1 Tax=Funneliformis caledonium TaxID=1117310 RepID=A0A9N8ZP99_9GLOM|nr:6175_t:CDS:2 [Funneliformis caledonium]
MVTVKKTEQELYDDAERELNDVKRILEEFVNERYKKCLTVLEDRLWKKKYSDKVEKNE